MSWLARLLARLRGVSPREAVATAGDVRRELVAAADDRRERFPEAEALRQEHRLSTSDGGRRRTRAERDLEGQARADAIRDGAAIPCAPAGTDTDNAEE